MSFDPFWLFHRFSRLGFVVKTKQQHQQFFAEKFALLTRKSCHGYVYVLGQLSQNEEHFLIYKMVLGLQGESMKATLESRTNRFIMVSAAT